MKVRDIFIHGVRKAEDSGSSIANIYPVTIPLFLTNFAAVLISAVLSSDDEAGAAWGEISRVMETLTQEDLPAGCSLVLQVGGFMRWLYDQDVDEEDPSSFTSYAYLATKWNEYALEESIRREHEQDDC